MQDAVDCPEWVVPFHLFKLLAEEVLNCFSSMLPMPQMVRPMLGGCYILADILFLNVLQYDLELVLMKNFHEFVHEYLQKPEFTELMRRLGALGDGRHDQSNFSETCRMVTPERQQFCPTLTLKCKLQVHCPRMSGKFPISILLLSCGRYHGTRYSKFC